VTSILYNLGITEQESETMLATSQSTELSLIEMEDLAIDRGNDPELQGPEWNRYTTLPLPSLKG